MGKFFDKVYQSTTDFPASVCSGECHSLVQVIPPRPLPCLSKERRCWENAALWWLWPRSSHVLPETTHEGMLSSLKNVVTSQTRPVICYSAFLRLFQVGSSAAESEESYGLYLSSAMPLVSEPPGLSQFSFSIRAGGAENLIKSVISWLWNVSGPMVRHYCHGLTISTHPSLVLQLFKSI